MTRDEIIRLAREAGFWVDSNGIINGGDNAAGLLDFAVLVAEAERDRMIAEGWRQCAEGQSTTQYCGLLEDAVKAEREAWAKMDEVDYRDHAIRARGNR
jgi:hypothetical protein